MSGLLTRLVERTKPVLGDFVWMDRNRRYLIFTRGSMDKGWPYTRPWRRKDEPAPNVEPNMVELTIPQPITSELYYSACGKIDRHNRCRQESLDTKKKLGTEDWSNRFNLSAFQWMWLVSGWHTKASLGRHRTKLISTIISLKRWYITPKIGSWCRVNRVGGGILLTLMTKPLTMKTSCLAGSMVLPDVEILYMWPPLRRW